MPEDKLTKKARKRRWYLAHRESECAKSSQWTKDHPAENNARSHKVYWASVATEEVQADRVRRRAFAEMRRGLASIVRSWRQQIRRKKRYWSEREEAIKRARQWKLDNPERARIAQKNWEIKNFEKVRARQAEKRAKQPIGSYTHADIRRLFAIQKGLCVGCGASITKKHHVDHVIPIARGGTNWPDNLQLLCPHCNQSKSARDPFEWAQSIGQLFV